MKLYNKSGNNYSHTIGEDTYFIANNDSADVPNEVAEIWLKINGIEKYIEPIDLEKAQKEAEEKAAAEKKVLEDENAALKKKIQDLEKAQKDNAKTKNK